MSACNGRSVSNALVYAAAIPFQQFTIACRGLDGRHRLGDPDHAAGSRASRPRRGSSSSPCSSAPGSRASRSLGGHRGPPARLVPGSPSRQLELRPRAPPYDTAVRAVVLDADGLPELVELPEPSGPGLLVRVLACGLCGSDVEKLGRAPRGTVLGHEVAGVLENGARVTVDAPRPVRDVRALPARATSRRAASSASCASRRAASPSELRATHCVPLPDTLGELDGIWVEPLACVLRAAELGAARARARRRLRRDRPAVDPGAAGAAATRCVAVDPRADRLAARTCSARETGDDDRSTPPCSPRRRASTTRCTGCEPGGTLLVFAAPDEHVPTTLDAVYRKELHVVGSRSATPGVLPRRGRAAADARAARGDDASARPLPRGRRAVSPRRRAEGRLHAVKAARLYAPGDLRIEEVPKPEPGPGDVLVQIEVALTDGTDLKTYRRGHPLLARESPAPFGHEFCGIVDGRRVVAANSAPCGACDGCARGEQCRELVVPRRRVRRLDRRARAHRRREPARRAAGRRARGRRDGRAARLLPARRRARGRAARATRSRSSAQARSG